LMLGTNKLTELPDALKALLNLKELFLGNVPDEHFGYRNENLFITLPEYIRYFKQLKSLWLCDLKLTSLPDWLGELENLEKLDIDDNLLTDLPPSMGKLKSLTWFNFSGNPFNPKLAKACRQGLNAVKGCKPDLDPVKAYLRAKAAEQTGSSQ